MKTYAPFIGLAVVLAGLFAADMAGWLGDSPVKPGAKAAPVDVTGWTHKELLAHLRANGVKLTVLESKQSVHGPMMWLSSGIGTVNVYLTKSPDDAREQSGIREGSIWFGRFYADGNHDALSMISEALGMRYEPPPPEVVEPEKSADEVLRAMEAF